MSSPVKAIEPRGIHVAEFFAGSGNLGAALARQGFTVAAFDLKISTSHDFTNCDKVQRMVDGALQKDTKYAHFAPPCNSFSIARWPKLRLVEGSYQYVKGQTLRSAGIGVFCYFSPLLLSLPGLADTPKENQTRR